MPSKEDAAKLAQVIAERHIKEIEALTAILGVGEAATSTLFLAAAFTIGRIMGMAQTVDVLKKIES